ncbi:MAG: hypothetical protein GC154_11465 [bacterium]|nr:hypothetical protein [bacterium]
MSMSIEQLPKTMWVMAALHDQDPEKFEVSEDDEVSLISLTDAEDVGFVPAWSSEEALSHWVHEFEVKVMSVEIDRDALLDIVGESGCEYMVIDMQAGQEEFPPDQVFELYEYEEGEGCGDDCGCGHDHDHGHDHAHNHDHDDCDCEHHHHEDGDER